MSAQKAFGFEFVNNDNNPIRMNPTLEDVLYLTGLPIIGKPVLPEKSRDPDAFTRVFGIELLTQLQINQKQHISLTKLQLIAKGVPHPQEKRIVAVLLLIIHCMIIPSHDGHVAMRSYLQFVEKLDEVNSYAWGTALLAFLYNGMNDFKLKSLTSIKGNTPILVAFFLYHIPKLRAALGIEVKRVEQPTLHLIPVLHALRSICHDMKSITDKVRPVFANLTDEDMCWHPYDSIRLLPGLHQQIKYRLLLAPLFCFNNVVNHSPHLVSKQFEELKDMTTREISEIRVLQIIRTKGNSGGNNQDFKKFYAKQLGLWEKRKVVENMFFVSSPPPSSPAHSNSRSTPSPPPSFPTHPNSRPTPSPENRNHSSPTPSPAHANSRQSHSRTPESSDHSQLRESSSENSQQSPLHLSPEQANTLVQSPIIENINQPQHSPPRSPLIENINPHPPSQPQPHITLAALTSPVNLGARAIKKPDRVTFSPGHIVYRAPQLKYRNYKDLFVELPKEPQPSLAMNLHATPMNLPPACEHAEGVSTKQGETAPTEEGVGFEPIEREIEGVEESNEKFSNVSSSVATDGDLQQVGFVMEPKNMNTELVDKTFKLPELEIDVRLSRLERIVAALKAAKREGKFRKISR